MISVAGCRAALVTALKAVPQLAGVHVHDYRRQADTEANARALFYDGTKYHGWQVSLAAKDPVAVQRAGQFAAAGSAGGGLARTTYRFEIEGFYEIDDLAASQKTFEELCDSVAKFLNSYGLLNTTDVRRQEPCAVNAISYILFARTLLLHYGLLSMGFVGRTAP